MAATDSLLAILLNTGADELRLATDEKPKMLARGTARALSMPATSAEMLHQILAPLLTPERESELERGAAVSTSYLHESSGETFHVTLRRRHTDGPEGALEAVFFHTGHAATATAGKSAKKEKSTAKAPSPALLDQDDASAALPVAAAPYADLAQTDEENPSSERSLSSASSVALGSELVGLIEQARSLRASDVHILDHAQPVVRIDGALHPLASAQPISSVRELFAALRPAASAGSAEELSFEGALDLHDLRVRYSVYATARGMAAALRLLPRLAPLLSDLHLPVSIGDLAQLPHGLVIVCGPTGCGKSATLAALAREVMRTRAALLITLEDPIEYGIRSERGLVRQREVGRDVRDFASGLRDALRGDPDVLLVGEMRDPATIALALTAAETGHLVLASLHSRSSAAAIERIVDGCPGRRESEVRVQLAQALRAVVAQRLLPRIGGGRVAALEVLRVNHSVASLIREGRTAQIATVLQSSKREGMLPLEASLADLIHSGAVERQQAAAVLNDPEAFATYLAG